MAENVGEMVVTLTGNTTQYQQQIKNAEDTTKSAMIEIRAAMDRGGQLTREVATSQEKYNAKVAEASRLLKQQVITQQTYNAVLAQANKELRQSTQGKFFGQGGFGELAKAAGTIGAITAGVEKFGAALLGVDSLVARININLRTSRDLAAETTQIIDRRTTTQFEITTSLGDPRKIAAELEEQVRTARANLRGLQDQLKVDQAKFENESFGRSIKTNIPFFRFAFDENFKIAENRLNETTELYKKVRERTRELERELGKVQNPERSPEVIKAARSLNFELENQITLLGLGANSARVFATAIKGASEEQLKQSRILAGALDLYEQGQQTINQFLTPQQQYDKELKRLRAQLLGGAIDQRTFQRAVDSAAESLRQATTATERVDATLVGSADARAKFLEFQTKLQTRGAGARALERAAQPDSEFNDETIKRLGEINEVLKQIRDRGQNPLRPLGLG